MYVVYASQVLKSFNIPYIVVSSLGVALPRHILQFTLKDKHLTDDGTSYWVYTGITSVGHTIISVKMQGPIIHAAVWHSGLEVGSVELDTITELPESLINKVSGILNSL
jgi:hypothetical protein